MIRIFPEVEEDGAAHGDEVVVFRMVLVVLVVMTFGGRNAIHHSRFR